MKVLFFICDRYEAFNIRKSQHMKASLKSSFNQRKEKLKDCIGVFVTIEKQDNDTDKKRLLKDICRLSKRCKLKTVLLAPFSHLSGHLAEPEKAIEIISDIEDSLGREGFDVKRSSFGYHKNLFLSVSGCDNNISWKSYSNGKII